MEFLVLGIAQGIIDLGERALGLLQGTGQAHQHRDRLIEQQGDGGKGHQHADAELPGQGEVAAHHQHRRRGQAGQPGLQRCDQGLASGYVLLGIDVERLQSGPLAEEGVVRAGAFQGFHHAHALHHLAPHFRPLHGHLFRGSPHGLAQPLKQQGVEQRHADH